MVEVVRRELLTPVGLRTLARGDPKYRGRYCGAAVRARRRLPQRHGLALADRRVPRGLPAVNKRSPESIEQGRRWLRPLIEHMEQDCIGQIAEIFEADEPHRPVGCPAQAWSVAEVLRLAVELEM